MDLTLSIGYTNKTFTSRPITPIFENFIIKNAGEQISLPSFAEYKSLSNDFSIKTNDAGDLGTYKLVQKISYKENLDYSVTCMTNLVVSYVTDFKGNFIKDVVMDCIKP